MQLYVLIYSNDSARLLHVRDGDGVACGVRFEYKGFIFI